MYKKFISFIGGLILASVGGIIWHNIIGEDILGIEMPSLVKGYYYQTWPNSQVEFISTIVSILICFLVGYLITSFIVFPILKKIKQFIQNMLNCLSNVVYSKFDLTSYPSKYYSIAEDEINNGNINKDLWAVSLVKSKGDENLRKVVYIKLRVKQLYDVSSD